MNSQELPIPELEPSTDGAIIKVFGVGGGGCNALAQMIAANIHGVKFKCVNTDLQALAKFEPENVIHLGSSLTRGLGAGADPDVGRAAAEESKDEIIAAIGNADMLFLTAGMGGGTGTGAVSVIARIAREMGVLTVAVVTEPFAFEGIKRTRVAEAGLEELCKNADSMIVVPNENLLTYLGPDITLIKAFAAANDIVTNAVQSIAELITTAGLINVDFADVKSVMTEMGHAIMSTGSGMGENRAYDAAISAIESPLLNNVDLQEARGILANISASADLSMGEFQIVGDVIRSIAADNATVVIGTVFDENLNYEMQVTVVATGLKPPEKNEAKKTEIKKIVRPPPKPKAPVVEAEPPQQVDAAADSPASVETVVPPSEDATPSSSAEVLPENDGADQVSVAESETPWSFAGAWSDGAEEQPSTMPMHSAAAQQAKAPAAQEPNEQPVAACIVCGGTSDVHEAKCPLNKNAVQEVADDDIEIDDKGAAKSKKVAMAGVAAGVVALASIFYFVMTKWDMTGNPDAVVNNGKPKVEMMQEVVEAED